MNLRSPFALLVAASLALPRAALAQEPAPPAPASEPPAPPPLPPPPPPAEATRPMPVGGDVVVLKGGGLYRGTLIESLPNDHATVQLATGQTVTIPWERIERIEHASATPSMPPPPPPPLRRVLRDEEKAIVHIESDTPVVLERRDMPMGRQWTVECSSPCDAPVDPSGEFRIAGESVRHSHPFAIVAARGEHVSLKVSPGSRGGFVGGLVFLGLGPLVGIAGATVLVIASNPTPTYTAGFYSNGSYTPAAAPQDNSSGKTAGGVLIGVGVALVLTGVIMVAGNAHTDVEQTAAKPKDAWLRRPTWREDPTGAGLPKVIGVPVLSTAF